MSESKNTISVDELGALQSFRAQIFAHVGATKMDEALDRVAGLARLEREVRATTGATDNDEIVGRITAGETALREVANLRLEAKKSEKAGIQREWNELVAKAESEKKLTPAEKASFLPTLLDEENDEKTGTTRAVITASSVKRLRGWYGAQSPKMPGTDEQPDDEASRPGLAATDLEAKVGAQLGVSPEALAKSKRQLMGIPGGRTGK